MNRIKKKKAQILDITCKKELGIPLFGRSNSVKRKKFSHRDTESRRRGMGAKRERERHGRGAGFHIEEEEEKKYN